MHLILPTAVAQQLAMCLSSVYINLASRVGKAYYQVPIAASCLHSTSKGRGGAASTAAAASSSIHAGAPANNPPAGTRRPERTARAMTTAWPWPWQATLLAAAAWLCLHAAVARLMEALWWRPRRLERHFARHGVRGPGYRLYLGSSIELSRLMEDASSRPAPRDEPHRVLPRVLAFHHHWDKLYGTVYRSTPH
jgi:hypothetical protein